MSLVTWIAAPSMATGAVRGFPLRKPIDR